MILHDDMQDSAQHFYTTSHLHHRTDSSDLTNQQSYWDNSLFTEGEDEEFPLFIIPHGLQHI